ncbi:TP53 regulating kinase [Nematocida major]|uniref:TP53 regulating kinase n=1 Tax=Nematocida major TaxID=1912982 RepID=UPI002008714C|nr:TP53 regulating kinase [Nematocida major]KAH9386206.1 TP53 regulating kinase [Nematocida major]
MESVSTGAEAVVYKRDAYILKVRVQKTYRIPEIDSSIRKSRTRLEQMLLRRIEHLDISPKVHELGPEEAAELLEISSSMQPMYTIKMDCLSGVTLKDALLAAGKEGQARTMELLCKVYASVGKLHAAGVMHGDLTLNNFIIDGESVKILDFGLGKLGVKAEDKAVDLYVLEKTILASQNLALEDLCRVALPEYEKHTQKGGIVLDKLKEVRRRGRKRELSAVG